MLLVRMLRLLGRLWWQGVRDDLERLIMLVVDELRPVAGHQHDVLGLRLRLVESLSGRA